MLLLYLISVCHASVLCGGKAISLARLPIHVVDRGPPASSREANPKFLGSYLVILQLRYSEVTIWRATQPVRLRCVTKSRCSRNSSDCRLRTRTPRDRSAYSLATVHCTIFQLSQRYTNCGIEAVIWLLKSKTPISCRQYSRVGCATRFR